MSIDVSTRYERLRDGQLKYQTMFENAMIKYEDLKLNQEVFGEGTGLE